MKFYDSGRAPNPRRVKIVLAEKNISVETVQIDINALQQRGENYTKLNPAQRVPAFETEEGVVLAESLAICRYLEAKFPEPNLFGANALEIGEIEMWNRRIEMGLFSHVGFAFRHTSPFMAEMEKPQITAWGEACKAKIPAELEMFEREVTGKAFLVNNRFTMADINLLVALDFMRIIKVKIPETLPELTRYHAALAARPACL